MPAPIVTLTRIAVSRRTPIARTRPASEGTATSVETVKQRSRRHSNPSVISRHKACVLPPLQRSSMATSALTDVYLDELSTLYDAEMQALRVLPRLRDAARSLKLRDALTRHCEETRLHVERLQLIFTHWGGRAATGHSAGLAGIVQEADERLN